MELPEKKLSDAELDIMLAIWQSPPPVQRADLEEQLQSHNWADTTLLTLLSKLVEKGYLSVERQGRHNLYRPLVSEADYRRWAAALLPSGGTGPGCSSRCGCCCPLASPCRSR